MVKAVFTKLFINRFLSQETKLLIYKVSIRPVMLYGFSVWFTMSPTAARELEIVERSILRLCVNRNFKSYNRRFSNKFIYEESDVTPFCRYALNSMYNFSLKLQFHRNSLITDIYRREVNLSWSDYYYISPLGILNEDMINTSTNLPLLPDFYKLNDRTCHRG